MAFVPGTADSFTRRRTASPYHGHHGAHLEEGSSESPGAESPWQREEGRAARGGRSEAAQSQRPARTPRPGAPPGGRQPLSLVNVAVVFTLGALALSGYGAQVSEVESNDYNGQECQSFLPVGGYTVVNIFATLLVLSAFLRLLLLSPWNLCHPLALLLLLCFPPRILLWLGHSPVYLMYLTVFTEIGVAVLAGYSCYWIATVFHALSAYSLVFAALVVHAHSCVGPSWDPPQARGANSSQTTPPTTTPITPQTTPSTPRASTSGH